MKTIKMLLLLLLTVLFTVSCGNSEKAFQEDFEASVKDKQGEELVNTLIELDGKYEDKLILKINLSALYLSAGETEKAVSFLNEGLPLAEKSKNPDERYMFYANYSEYKLRDEKFEESEKYARKSLEDTEDDNLGVSLTLAKALTAQKKYSDAYIIFKENWKTKGLLFGEEDISAFINVISQVPPDDESLIILITLLDELKVKNPAAQGVGIKQAQILEQAGAPLSALIAIFSEIETSRYSGMIDNAGIEKNLNSLAARFSNPELGERGDAGLKLIEGYADFINERWERADAVFTELNPELPITFYYYLKLASRIQTGMGTKEDFAAFVTLERNYSSMQGYYYNFWKGLKKGGSGYSKEAAEPALRGCILASPFTRTAAESRIELGRLYGVENGEAILLPEELVYFYQGILNGAPIEILDSVAALLSMEDNIFVQDAMVLMKEAFTNERISEWFKAKAEGSDNQLLKERVSSLLS